MKWISVTIFILASLASAYVLFQLPEWLSQYSARLDLATVNEVSPVLQRVHLTIGINLLAGLALIALLASNRNQYEREIREYKFSNQDLETTEKEAGKEYGGEIYLGDPEEILAAEIETKEVFSKALSQVCNVLEASQGAVFQVVENKEYNSINLLSSYAYHIPEGEQISFRFGEGIAGQVAKEGKVANIDTVPEGYIKIFSGLGQSTPKHLLVLPITEEEDVVGVVEISSFKPFQENQIQALKNYFSKLALKLSNNDNVRLKEAKQ
jgi:putative methionine-R-sulfoxide reductase with GAF domain